MSDLSRRAIIIAELANAHQGCSGELFSLIGEAAGSGADAVKFQWFKYDCLATRDHHFFSEYKSLFIAEERWLEALEQARELSLKVWVDVFDSWGLGMAERHAAKIEGVKIAPTVLQAGQLVSKLGLLDKPVLLGVGGWYSEEINRFMDSYKDTFRQKLYLMHGFQGYPTALEDIKLSRIGDLKKRYAVKAGFADHIDASNPLALKIPVYAYFCGADVIEKHITLDRSRQGYDYYSSLEPPEFRQMVKEIREAENAYGNPEVSPAERSYLKDSVRVVAGEAIGAGELITTEKVLYKRTDNSAALMPLDFESRLPAVAVEDLGEDKPLEAEMLKKPKIVLAVICRLKSTRLPKKALLKINGVESVARCLINALSIPEVDEVVLATSDLPEDDPLQEMNLGGKVKVYRGDPDNVAARMCGAAALTGADVILRVTGDTPAVGPEVVSLLIKSHLETGVDLTMADQEVPVGIGADVYTAVSLKKLLDQPKALTHSEYLSFYFVNNPHLFAVRKVSLPQQYRHPAWRLTLDEKEDLDLFEAIYSALQVGVEPLNFSDLAKYLLDNPAVAKLNSGVALKWKDNRDLVAEINEATKL